MMVLAAIAVVAMATCVGYYFGRRAGSARPTWKKRTSRVALGRLVMSLLVLVTARRIRRRFWAEPLLADAVHLWSLRLVAPVEILRGSVARRWS